MTSRERFGRTDDLALPGRRRTMRELALFAGAGGGILGGILLGWRTVCAVEIDPYCRDVLLARQRDGHLPRFPIWDDVRTFDGRPWRGHVDVISAGFPCQDISSAGKRAGLDGARSGLWREAARIIGEVRPQSVLLENSPHLRTRGLGRVLCDLAELGYDAQWGVLGARHVGAPHWRDRMWIVAYAHSVGYSPERAGAEYVADGEEITMSACADAGRGDASDANDERQRERAIYAEMGRTSAPPGFNASGISRQRRSISQAADTDGAALRQQPRRRSRTDGKEATVTRGANWWPVDILQGVDDGLAHRMDRTRATGNGQVPAVAALAWRTLTVTDTED